MCGWTLGRGLVHAPQRVDEAEPADERLVRTMGGAEPSGDRLAIEMHVELHAERTVLVVVRVVVHCGERTQGRR